MDEKSTPRPVPSSKETYTPRNDNVPPQSTKVPMPPVSPPKDKK